MAKKSIEQVPFLRPGDPISHKDYNAILEQAQRLGFEHDKGGDTEVGTAVTGKYIARPMPINFKAPFDIPAYSIFGVDKAAPAWDDPVKIKANRDDVNIAHFTNINIAVSEGSQGVCFPVGFFSPFQVKYSGVVPQPGGLCGVQPGTMVVNRSYVGYVCLSRPKQGRIWGCKAHDSSYIAQVTDRFDGANMPILSEGRIRIFKRVGSKIHHTNIYKTAFSDCEQPIEEGEYVKAIPVNGVGLMVHPCGEQTSFSVSSSSSGSSESSESSGSSESSESSSASSSSSGCVLCFEAVTNIARDGNEICASRAKICFDVSTMCFDIEPLDDVCVQLC
jgi:hypothetical protein